MLRGYACFLTRRPMPFVSHAIFFVSSLFGSAELTCMESIKREESVQSVWATSSWRILNSVRNKLSVRHLDEMVDDGKIRIQQEYLFQSIELHKLKHRNIKTSLWRFN